MPHIRIRGVKQEAVANISRTLLHALASLCGNNEASYSLEWLPSTNYRDGQLVSSTPMVEVLWFPRDQETQQAVEACVRHALLAETRLTEKIEHLIVMFIELEPQAYYRNGQHF
jgi:hypothetical protein